MEENDITEEYIANVSSVYPLTTFQDPNDDTEIETEGDEEDEIILGSNWS